MVYHLMCFGYIVDNSLSLVSAPQIPSYLEQLLHPPLLILYFLTIHRVQFFFTGSMNTL